MVIVQVTVVSAYSQKRYLWGDTVCHWENAGSKTVEEKNSYIKPSSVSEVLWLSLCAERALVSARWRSRQGLPNPIPQTPKKQRQFSATMTFVQGSQQQENAAGEASTERKMSRSRTLNLRPAEKATGG
ncbi:hypothetical protein ASPFODRAFT_55112 [Aspergillus luchuensis CBS 106.47]|uniref:Uncharacterized protein n=1 Tax=Aspergillus luchuensis (strain CBS 106.47) TaxID=1137211 RepID=A0A1M3SYC5_ASPLC|nr:hypothetical protein ASPFODRAFT_55112 [Aspergillus luchuensis CBS 106.47]